MGIKNQTTNYTMKNLKYIFFLVSAFLVFSCDKEETKVTFLKSTPPVLVASSTADLVLNKAQENFSSLQFQWSNPTFEFSNGVNTQNVSYVLQIDEAGKNFGSAKQVALGFTNGVSKSFTVKELNTSLSGLELADFVAQNFEFRVKATLSNNSVPVYSNVVKIKITTYLDVVFPVPAKLFITGAATPADWQSASGSEPVPPNQEFTKINSYLFVINSLNLKASAGYLIIPVYSSWGVKYGFTGEKLKNNPSGDTFKPGGEDFVSPSNAKAYKISVNFKTGKTTIE
jgi:starch-binding outer membrane protein SusE/F